ncbi:GNAT family N-acetyltransferase [Haloarchaeobius amylolyticus]|uniref:GNAT family N-acetyltransferase n=1 Tax=Haloarchaeobius amylolyticus TaxID=1198296 RepID=UPI00226DBB81|nr:GNAT family protein [Haloarchaeobius amylolyticus]
MPGAPFLHGETVTLRTMEEDDAVFLRDHSNDPRIRRPMTMTGPTNLEQQREHMPDGDDDGPGFSVLVCVEGEQTGYNEQYVAEDGDTTVEPVGVVFCWPREETAGDFEIAYWLTPPAHGEGYMSEAVSLALDHAFGQLRLHRIRARVLTWNDGSRALLEKLGFTEEGVMRDAKFVDGEYVDTHLYSILEDEWRAEDA